MANRNPQLNANGELHHLLSIDGLPKAVIERILTTADSFINVAEREVKGREDAAHAAAVLADQRRGGAEPHGRVPDGAEVRQLELAKEHGALNAGRRCRPARALHSPRFCRRP